MSDPGSSEVPIDYAMTASAMFDRVKEARENGGFIGENDFDLAYRLGVEALDGREIDHLALHAALNAEQAKRAPAGG